MLSAATRSLLMTQPQTGIRQLTLSAGVGTDAERKAALEGDGLPMVSGLAVYPAATNLCTNGGFETNTTGWGLNGAGVQSQTRITTDSVFGVACNEVVVDGAVGGQGLITGGLANAIAVVAGTAYTLSGYVKSVSGSTSGISAVDWYTAADAYISTSSASPTYTAAFARYSLTATAPVTATKALVSFRISPAVAATYRIDGVKFETGSIATPYTDTDGASAARVAGRVQLPVEGLFTPTQMAVMARARFPYANTARTSGDGILLSFRDAANDLVEVRYDFTLAQWEIERNNAGVGTVHAFADTWAADASVTVFAAATAAALKLSVDGAAFTSVADTNIPTISATTADFGSDGSSGSYISGNVRWAILFKGTVTDADAALPWVVQDNVPTLRQIETLSKGSRPTCLIPGRMTDAILLPAYYEPL